ncbi:substrate-binding domain-containing protein [uncultured Clostridium sp.]|uniref:substrate-binding domain-containing protein n=1 Tax=uncultured Clostridium sp. TaxID=59620 RepID=UPI003458C782
MGIENDKASYISTSYLISMGHRNIAIIIGNVNDYGISGLRMKGYIEALRDNSIVYNEDYVAIGNYSSEGAYNATKKLLNKHREITAIFAISDFMAVGCAKAISDMGLVVGKDISIIGFDGMDVSKFYVPSITTTVQPKEEMAKVSINLLFKLINNEESHKHILLNTYLVKRQSCNEIKR